MRRANVYVDGFNLYYGAVRGTPYKWLNLLELSKGLLKADVTINRIRYFTARVAARPNNLQAPDRQTAFLRALGTIPNLSIHFGQFLTNTTTMPLANGGGLVTVLKTEEKGSDVNLASFLLLDAFAKEYDVALVLSNDTDLVLPIQEARARFGVTIGVSCPVYTPGRWPSRELVAATDFNAHINRKRKKLLRDSQFPDELKDATGVFRKPATW